MRCHTRKLYPLRYLLVVALCTASHAAADGRSLQNGFYYFGPSTITLDSGASGVICTDADGTKSICEQGPKVVVKGEATCNWPEGQQNPCTNFGYEFEYSDAQPGTNLECEIKRYSPRTGESRVPYTRPIETESGRIAFLTFRTYAPVEDKVLFSEVHTCSYLGEPVASIEFMIWYEPGVGGPGSSDDADQYFSEVPNACSGPYLTEQTAAGMLRSGNARKHAASEHIPALQSQCIYGAGSKPGQVGYVFKFMLSDMFDVDKVDEQQLDFNATFANGGAAPNKIMQSPGERAYVFFKGDRATLFVITGIKGRNSFAGRAQEFVAQYYLDHPDMDEDARIGALLMQADLHMRHWTQE